VIFCEYLTNCSPPSKNSRRTSSGGEVFERRVGMIKERGTLSLSKKANPLSRNTVQVGIGGLNAGEKKNKQGDSFRLTCSGK